MLNLKTLRVCSKQSLAVNSGPFAIKITEVTKFWVKSFFKLFLKSKSTSENIIYRVVTFVPVLSSPFEACGSVLIFEPHFGSGVEIEEITTRNRFSLFFYGLQVLFFGGRLLLTVIPFQCELKNDVLALKDEKNMS